MELEDRRGRSKPFPDRARLSDRRQAGDPHRRRDAQRRRRARTASGSVAVPSEGKVALASRIYVEGRHDAELVEQVWGDDLRDRGRRRRIPRRRRRSRRASSRSSARARATARRARRPSRRRVEGGADRRRGAPRTRRRAHARRRPSVHRHLAGGQAGAARYRGMAGRAEGRRTGRRACAVRWAGRTHSRPTPRGRGSASAAGCGTGTISSLHSSAGSRN